MEQGKIYTLALRRWQRRDGVFKTQFTEGDISRDTNFTINQLFFISRVFNISW